MSDTMSLVTIVSLGLVLASVSCEEDLSVRLSGGRYVEAGYLEVWRGDKWGLLCGDTQKVRIPTQTDPVASQARQGGPTRSGGLRRGSLGRFAREVRQVETRHGSATSVCDT